MKNILIGIFLLVTSLGFTSPTYLQVNLHSYGCGMFSVLGYVLGVLQEYEKNPYSGVEVDFENYGLYYDPSYGSNWWSYYFEPIKIGNKDSSDIKHFNIDEFCHYSFYSEFQLSREQNHDLIEKYFHIRPEIQKKIDQFVEDRFSGHHIIGIHYRGTDKTLEAPFVPYERVIECVNTYITQNNVQNFKIFIASDEQEVIYQLLNAFGEDRVIGYSTMRSSNGQALHFNVASQKLHGEEALIDCVLLSKSDLLIRTSSNLSRWSTYFNPSIPVIELNQRN